MKTLKVDNIRIDGGTQAREEIDNDAVRDYADILQENNGEGLPPIEVYFDGSQYWLSDGFHRWHAHRQAGLGTIQANVIQGTQRDAILAAVGANAAHGLKRSNADKRKAVRMLLEDDEWQQKSDRWIADKAKVSHTFVRTCRTDSGGNVSTCDGYSGANVCTSPKKKTRKGQDGKEYPATQPTRQEQIADHFNSSANKQEKPEKPKVYRADAPLPEAYVDADGEPVPEGLLPVWRLGTGLGKLVNDARTLKFEIGKLNDSEMSSQFTLAAFEHIQDVIDELECSRPCKVLDGSWLAEGEVNG